MTLDLFGEPIVDPDCGFEQFYGFYPRKVKKEDARKAWRQLNPSIALAAVIFLALEQQKENNWANREKQFVPYPASWIRGKCWEDAIEPVNLKDPKQMWNGQKNPREMW